MTTSFCGFHYACVRGVEHADTASVELQDQALFRVHADAITCESLTVEVERAKQDPLTDLPERAIILAVGKDNLDVEE